MKKIRIAFIYHKNNAYLSGKHYDNTYYNFFMKALRQNEEIEIKDFPTKEIFDASVLKNKFDIILLWENNDYGMPSEIKGIQELDIPVIAKGADPAGAKKSIKFHKKWKIDYYFHFHHKDFFHEQYPANFKFKTIIFGIESKLYENLTPFNKRISNKILNSGNVGNMKITSRIINKIKNPKWNALRCYKLRTLCNNLPCVDYTFTLQHEYVGDKYPLLLQKYCSAIAACTYNPLIKFWEIPAAGCLTFMEITKKNRGEFLGYEDEKTAIFIDENNYSEKFDEYLSDSQNNKWKKIANAGREYTLKNFTNKKAVESLVELMKKLL
jgi:hypothetical protein